MKKTLIGVLLLGLFFVSFFFYATFAEEPTLSLTAHNAVILFMSGNVKVKQAALEEWIDATQGMALFPGDIIKTDSGSWVEIGVGSDRANVMRIKESTIVELTSLDPVKMNLLQGELRALVEKLDPGTRGSEGPSSYRRRVSILRHHPRRIGGNKF